MLDKYGEDEARKLLDDKDFLLEWNGGQRNFAKQVISIPNPFEGTVNHTYVFRNTQSTYFYRHMHV